MSPARSRLSIGDMTKAVRLAGAALAAVFAVAVCVAVGQLTYGFYEIYGTDPQAGDFTVGTLLTGAILVVPAALLVAAAVTAAGGLAGWPPRRPRFLPAAGLALALSVVGAVGGALLGTRTKLDGQRRAAAACSAEEREALRALGTVPSDGVYGTGMADGSCRGFLGFVNDADAGVRLAAVREQVTSQGWRATESGPETRTVYQKEGQGLEMTVVRDKAVEVTFSLT